MTEQQAVALVFCAWLLGSTYWAMTCGWVAAEKSRSGPKWAAMGFLLWMLAFLPLAVAPDLSEYDGE